MQQSINRLLMLAVVATTVVFPLAGAAQPQVGNPPSPVPPSVSTTSTLEDDYTLGPGDSIRVEIFRVPQYSGDHRVLVNGSLNLALVGSVSVQGLTLEQAAEAIAAKYSRILRLPLVTVSLIAPRQVEVGITGEIDNPGSYILDAGSGQLPSITQVLDAAGGIRQSADLRQIQVRRPQRSGVDQVITVDLWQFLQTGDSRHNITLRDGDSVFVPTATSVNLAESPQIAAASFAAQEDTPISIAIVGEVFRPGSYTVTGTARTAAAGVPGDVNTLGTAPTVTRAIQVAGGITPTADVRRIQIRRLTRTGVEQSFEVDLWQLLQAGDLGQDALLQDRDIITVPTATAIDQTEATAIASASFSPDRIRINVIGEVPRAGVIEVPPNTPLNQGLLAAGGFNNRAARDRVELVRLNPNGSVTRQSIEVDFAQGLNDETNPALRNNDVIIVSRNGLASVSDALEGATNPLARFFTLFTLPLNFLRLF